jgi:cysteine-rich repeat protein
MKLKHAAAALPALLLASSAAAVRQPEYLDERPLEVAHGTPHRAEVTSTWNVPAAARLPWNRFVDAHGAWQAIWDADTGVPMRLYGRGIAAPGAVADPAIAEAAARAVLVAQLELLAPGAAKHDFTLAANQLHGAGTMRTVSFWQTFQGLPIEGAAVNFLFKNDRLFVIGSTASPQVEAKIPPTIVGAAQAEAAARAWIEQHYGARPELLGIDDPVILPIVRERDAGPATLEHRVVVPVTVDLAEPRGRWTVYVDAGRGTPLARTQLLRFAQGTVKYKVPVRYPLSDKADYAAMYTTHTIAGAAVTSNLAGLVTWTGTQAVTVTPGLIGTYVRIRNNGTAAAGTLSLAPDGTAVWDHTATERSDAQLAGFIHANLIKEFARTRLDANLAWINRRLDVFTNENSTCNAYSTGDDIHFYVRSNQCENTARLADVVYHEFGHSIHRNAIIPGAGSWNGALSEGVSDYLAATYTGDPGMGRGFFHNHNAMRHIDPPDREKVWPDDVVGQVHADGEIIGGTLWDLRKAMIAALGEDAGRRKADDLYYAIIQRASNIPTTYVEALAADDDDGDLSNGTPHKCIIDAAFGAHGLADGGSVAAGSIDPPTLDELTLTLRPSETSGACPPPAVASAQATWRLRATPATGGVVDFTGSGSAFTATLPGDAPGQVLQYQVQVTFADGSSKLFPANPADRWYEVYVGPVTVVRCFDFERDAADDGWELGEGWSWGAPTGAGGDPERAYSGAHVIGTDLGEGGSDGLYEPNGVYRADSPVVTIPGDWDQVRLQYRRWLGVEDAVYDHAIIEVDGVERWTNLATPAEDTHHRDREWRFHDLDITAEAADGAVQITFHLDADPGLEFGGWTVDDVCIVAIGAGRCGDGLLTAPEECDDGNQVDGDGCSADCQLEGGGGGGGADGDEIAGGCCSAGDRGVAGPLLLGLATLLVVRRRRRAA